MADWSLRPTETVSSSLPLAIVTITNSWVRGPLATIGLLPSKRVARTARGTWTFLRHLWSEQAAAVTTGEPCVPSQNNNTSFIPRSNAGFLFPCPLMWHKRPLSLRAWSHTTVIHLKRHWDVPRSPVRSLAVTLVASSFHPVGKALPSTGRGRWWRGMWGSD